MDLDLTEEQKMLQATVRDFAERELAPAAARIDETGECPAEELKKIAGLGLFGLTIPEEYGGSGRGKIDLCLAVEELAWASAAIDDYLRVSLSLAIVPVIEFGTEAQKKKYLPPHASGEKMACFALTEAGAGSDPAGMETTAERRGDGYVINGNKLFISIGDQADIVTVFASTDRSKRQHGISAFIVDRNNPGFSVGKAEPKMGLHGLNSVELVFRDCFVPVEDRIGEEGQGLRIALNALDVSRITVGAEGVGISRAAFEAALNYARERRQFGQPIGSFQAIQWMLADMATRIEATRLLTYQAAFLCDQGRSFVREAAMAKVYGAETAKFVTDKALQIHGGYGYTKAYPVERYFRDARITEIYEGTSEIMRLTIARSLLKEG